MVQKFNEPVLVYELQSADGTIIDLSGIAGNAAAIAAAPANPIVGSSGASVAAVGQEKVQKVTLTITALVMNVTAALDYGSVAFADLGDTNLMLLGAESDLAVTKGEVSTGIEATVDLDMGIGTAAASATTLATTMIDVLAKIDLDADTAVVQFDGHSSLATTMPLVIASGASNQLFINCGLPVGITVDDTLTMTGTVTLYYIDMGNVTS